MAPQRALIVGGSLGGLFVANLLRRKGWAVEVFERASGELEGRGAGIVTHPELFDALACAELVVDESIGVRVQERVTLAADGSRIAAQAMPQILTAWSKLYRLLRQGIPTEHYHNSSNLVGLTQSTTEVVARFADGSERRGCILIGADGIRSTVRQHCLPGVQPTYVGYVAWRGLVDEAILSERTKKDAFPYFAFGLPANEQFVAYPVAGSDNSVAPGRRRYNFVWYRPASPAELQNLMTDVDGKFWSEGIPPQRIRPDVLAESRSEARRVLAPQFAEVVEKSSGLLFQPIYDLAAPWMSLGRVALLGDSVFVARPHCGMGVTKAAADALALTRALTDHDDVLEALLAYEAERLPIGRHIVSHARSLGHYLEARTNGTRSAEDVMTTTAMPLHSSGPHHSS